MEGEVSGIAKLGIVLIALAVLIGLGFGIFQISKGTANTGVNDVQKELDGVSTSQYTTYDQTTITGTMVRSAVQDFEGEQVAVLIATQAWVNFLKDNSLKAEDGNAPSKGITDKASGIATSYDASGTKMQLPVVFAFKDKALNTTIGSGSSASSGSYTMSTSKGEAANGAFINYNALLGTPSASVPENSEASMGVTKTKCKINNVDYNMAGIYFDTNKFVCTSGFAADASGRVQYNNVTKNIQQTGTTEFIPTGAKFSSFLIKDASGTIMGFACQQIGQ